VRQEARGGLLLSCAKSLSLTTCCRTPLKVQPHNQSTRLRNSCQEKSFFGSRSARGFGRSRIGAVDHGSVAAAGAGRRSGFGMALGTLKPAKRLQE